MDYHLNSKLSTIAFKFEELERELKEVQKMGVWNEILSHYNGHPLVNLDDYFDNEFGDDYGPSNPWDAPGMKISDFI